MNSIIAKTSPVLKLIYFPINQGIAIMAPNAIKIIDYAGYFTFPHFSFCAVCQRHLLAAYVEA